jgi:hypothetical protein
VSLYADDAAVFSQTNQGGSSCGGKNPGNFLVMPHVSSPIEINVLSIPFSVTI